MDEIDEVSSTTKDEGMTEKVRESSSSFPGDTGAGVGDSSGSGCEDPDLSLNARKRKSVAIDEEEEVEESGSAVTPSTTTNMDVDGVVESSAVAVAEEVATSSSSIIAEVEEPEVDLRVSYNKEPIPIRISLKKTVGDLKRMIEAVTKIAPELQKVLVKGIAKDETVLESLGLSAGSKVMVIGTKLDDVLAVNKAPTAAELKADESASSSIASQTWCSLPRHAKIIDKGIPDDAMPGILDCNDPLPDFPLSGMVNAKGSKLRLTFKLEADELWIGTKERTDKVSIGSIRNVVSQPIPGVEHFHILAVQLGPTEASRIFIYWLPAQYVRAVKDALGGA